MDNNEVVAGLRSLAFFLEKNDTLPIEPFAGPVLGLNLDFRVRSVEQLRAVARAMRTFVKVDPKEGYLAQEYYSIRKQFHGLTVTVRIDREKVCRKVTKLVEKTEWECPEESLLSEE